MAVWKLPMRNPSKSTPGCSSGESPGLEATYEESKRGVHDDHPAPPPFVCYEESKLVYPGMLGGGEACVWKLPMRNPTPTSVRNSGLTDGVWKLPMRNPSSFYTNTDGPEDHVWKLPMRNPSLSSTTR